MNLTQSNRSVDATIPVMPGILSKMRLLFFALSLAGRLCAGGRAACPK